MIRRPPRSTRTDTSFPTRRSSDLGDRQPTQGHDVHGQPERTERHGCDQDAQRDRDERDDRDASVHQEQDQDDDDEDRGIAEGLRSEEHTSELQSLMSNSYAVFCLKKKTPKHTAIDEYVP